MKFLIALLLSVPREEQLGGVWGSGRSQEQKEGKLVQKETLTVNTHEGIQPYKNLMDFELT